MRYVPIVALALTIPSIALAQRGRGAGLPRSDDGPYGALSYRFIGPPGNRTIAVAGIPGNSHTYYVGAASGGIWKTTDAGTTWQPIFDKQPVSSIGSLAIAPSDSNTVWAGTGESFIRSHVSLGWGIYEAEASAMQEQLRKEFDLRTRSAVTKAVADAREGQRSEVEDLKQQLEARESQVDQLQQNELELRRRSRELDERSKKLELEAARKVDAAMQQVESTISARLSEEHRLTDLARDKQLADLRRQLEDAHRRAAQGSQQTQGEAFEANLEDSLRRAHPLDGFEAVSNGVRGRILYSVFATRVATRLEGSFGSARTRRHSAQSGSPHYVKISVSLVLLSQP